MELRSQRIAAVLGSAFDSCSRSLMPAFEVFYSLVALAGGEHRSGLKHAFKAQLRQFIGEVSYLIVLLANASFRSRTDKHADELSPFFFELAIEFEQLNAVFRLNFA